MLISYRQQVLEVTARAITYYLDVSAECTRRIVAVEGAVKAMCNRLVVADVVGSRASKDLAEQCIKVSKHLTIPLSLYFAVFICSSAIRNTINNLHKYIFVCFTTVQGRD